jgi:tetratricopeptide (TPR) repeat protein
MRPRVLLVIAMAIAIPIILAPVVAAGATPNADKRARAHYQAAQSFFTAGDFEHAIVEFKAAYELAPRPLLLYNLGSAYRRLGEETGAIEDKRLALDSYRRYLAAEPKGKAAGDARAYATELEAQIAALEAARPPLPVAPEPPPAPVAAPEPPPTRVPAPTPADAPTEKKSGASFRIAGIATASVGVALVGAGVYFALKARSAQDDLTALQAGGAWSQSKYDDGTSANRNMYICLGVGGAAIAAGTIFYFVLGRDEPRSIAVVPGVGSLAVSGRF